MLIPLIPVILSPIFNFFFFKLGLSDYFSLLLWYFLFTLMGILAAPLVFLAFSGRGDAGFAVSKVIGFLIVGYFSWLLPQLGIYGFTWLAVVIGFLILSLISFYLQWKYPDSNLRNLFRLHGRTIVLSETLFSSLFFIFLISISFHPEIFGGEKPMDFSILNFLSRTETLPVTDPWAAGHVMKYYYMGYYFFAGMIKVTGISGQTGYLLALTTVPALMASSAYSLFMLVLKRRWMAAFSAFCLVTLSTWKSFFEIIFSGAEFNLKYFWSCTRVFDKNYFAEFPVWSFLFADLHPHVMAYPFTVAALLFATVFVMDGVSEKSYKIKKNGIYFVLFSLLWGGLLAINSWDFIIFGIVFSTMIFVSFFFRRLSIQHFCFHSFFLPLLVLVSSIIFYLPMLEILSSGRKTIWGVVSGQANSFANIFQHQGQWFILILLLGGMILVCKLRKKGKKIIYKSSVQTVQIFSFLIFGLSGILLILIIENLFFMDRMNTLFKGYNNVWILLFISVFSLFRYFIFFLKRGRYRIITTLILFLVIALFVGTCFNFYSLLASPRGRLSRPSLDGNIYLKRIAPYDYYVIDWARSNIKGTPFLLEWYGDYRRLDSCRVSMHTGLPSWLGWEGHVRLRGVSLRDVVIRKRFIDFVYNSSDPLKVHQELVKRGIQLVMAGEVERRVYKSGNFEKFDQYSDLFIPLVKYGRSALYAVVKSEDPAHFENFTY